MKFARISPFVVCLVLAYLPVTAAAAGRVKGIKESSHVHTSRRLKKGPKSRECKYGERKDEVTFSCKSRQGDEKGSRDSSDDSQAGTTRGISLDMSNLEHVKDEIKYRVSSDEDGMGIEVAYKNKIEEIVDGSKVKTDTNTEFQIWFTEIIEYRKGSSSSDATVTGVAARAVNASSTANDQEEDDDDDVIGEAYDWENDEVVQTLPLGKWQDFSSVRNDDDRIVSYFFVESDDGVAQFNFTITRADQGEKASANSVKIDVRILDFPWRRDDSYVALVSTVSSQQKIKMKYHDKATAGTSRNGKPRHVHSTEEVEIDFADARKAVDGGFAFGAYTWEKLAEATMTDDYVQIQHNGTNMTVLNLVEEADDNTKAAIQVLATSPEDYGSSSFQTIAYSFVGGAAQGSPNIYWDPEAGISYESAALSFEAFSHAPRLAMYGGALMSTAILLLLA